MAAVSARLAAGWLGRARPVDSRMISSVDSSTRLAAQRHALDQVAEHLRRRRRPISASGWRTVVSGGRDPAGHRQVVEADDAQVLRDPQPALPGGLVDAERLLVVPAKMAVGRSGQVEQLAGRA